MRAIADWDISPAEATVISALMALGAAFIALSGVLLKMHQDKYQYLATKLDSKFEQAATQLSNKNAAVRIAGAYSVGALTDEWKRLRKSGSVDQAQACVNLLCGYLRTSFQNVPAGHERVVEKRTSIRKPDGSTDEMLITYSPDENEVRRVIIEIVARHCRGKKRLRPFSRSGWHRTSWSDLYFNFDNCTMYDMNFDDCLFNRELSMVNSTILGSGSFEGTSFKGGLNARGAKFYKNASFERSIFGNRAVFLGTRFLGLVTFSEVIFKAAANFSEAKFSESGQFRLANFLGYSTFDNCILARGASFSRVFFCSVAQFNSVAFGEHKSLSPLADIDFSDSCFYGGLVLSDSRVFIPLSINASTIYGDIKVERSYFRSPVSLSSAGVGGVFGVLDSASESSVMGDLKSIVKEGLAISPTATIRMHVRKFTSIMSRL